MTKRAMRKSLDENIECLSATLKQQGAPVASLRSCKLTPGLHVDLLPGAFLCSWRRAYSRAPCQKVKSAARLQKLLYSVSY